MSNKILTLSFHAVSPMHIADASSGDAHVDHNGRVRDGKVPKTMPVTRIERRPVLIPAAVSGREKDEVMMFPYIKANNLVGRLRRFAQDVVNEQCVAMNVTMSDKTYRGLSCGASSGTPTGGDVSLSERRMAGKHVYMGVFGGGDGMHPSGMNFGDMNLCHQFLVGANAISGEVDEDLTTDIAPYMLTAPTSLVRRDRLWEASDINIERVIKDGEKAAQAWAELIGGVPVEPDEEADEKDSKDAKKARREQLRNLVAYEVALAGLGYQGTVVLKEDITDAQVGLILEALMRLAKQNALGGKSSKGYGRFNLVVKVNDNILFSSVDGKIAMVSKEAESYISEMEAELEDLDIKELEGYFNG